MRPKANEFEVDVYINPEYRKLLTRESIFWAEGGAVQHGSGLTVQASPLNRALKGAISFDNLQGVTLNKRRRQPRAVRQRSWRRSARSVGQSGAVSGIRADLRASGQPLDRLAGDLAAGVSNLDTLLQPYINVEPGRARAAHLRAAAGQHHRLALSRRPERGARRRRNRLAADRHAGLFRGVEVGTITGFYLGAMSDRVHVALRISKKYQHLVRNNSVFWLASGTTCSSLTGGVIKSGTFQQFIRGGIAFATPPTIPLAPKATPNKHFLLNPEEPKDWKTWGTAIPRD